LGVSLDYLYFGKNECSEVGEIVEMCRGKGLKEIRKASYILRAFLMNNAQYKIQLFGHMLEYQCMDKIPKHLKGCGSGSLWIKKIK